MPKPIGITTSQNNSKELLHDVLDKLIETQVQSAETIIGLKDCINSNTEQLKELRIILSDVNAHFSNGFRHEIKEHIDEVSKRIENQFTSLMNSKTESLHNVIVDFINTLKSPKSWLTGFLFIGSLFGVIATIVTIVVKYLGSGNIPPVNP